MMMESSSSARISSRSTPATRSRARIEQINGTSSVDTNSTASTTSTTNQTTSSKRKPFSPLPLGLFPCKFDLHSGFSLRSTPCSPQIASASTSTSPPASTSTSTSKDKEKEKMARCGKTKAVNGAAASSLTSSGKTSSGKKQASKKVLPSGPNVDASNKKQPTPRAKTPVRPERTEMDVDLVENRSTAIDLDSDEDEEAAWEHKSPARRLFVGMGMGMMGSPSSSSKKPGQPKSKLSMMMMDDDPEIITATSNGNTNASASSSTSAVRPTLRPSPKLTSKKTSTSAISIEKRTWTGRDSPSASPIMSKKFRSVASVPVAVTDVEGDATMNEEEDGDKTIMPLDDENADVHAVGFEVWSDQATGGNTVRRDAGYFDLGMDGAEVVRTPTVVPAATPKYTAENIRNVGKNKLPFPTPADPAVAIDENTDKGQENVPPLGWVDLTALAGDKLKSVCTPSRDKFADQFATPGSGSSRRGTPSYGDPSSVSSLASTPATDRVRKTSTVSLAPSPAKASSVRGPTSTSTSISTLTSSPTPPLTPEVELPTPRTRLGSGMKRSLTKSLLDLRDAAGLGGRVLRSGRGRDL